MTFVEVVKEEAVQLGKSVTDDDIEHIIWSETGFPHFWNIPKDGDTPEQCFRKQVREALSKL